MYAKTLFKPTRPDKIHNLIQSYNRQKTPYFFQYAKDKTINQVSPKNNSCVNRIQDIIGNPKFDFQTKQLGKFNYKILLYDKKIDTKSQRAQNVIADFKDLLQQYNLKLNDTGDEHDNYSYIAKKIKDELFDKYYDDRYVCDVLTKHYFHDKHTTRKKMFLICFSDIINENLRKNLDDNIVFCQDCGEEVKISNSNTKTIRCEKCQQIADYKPVGKKIVTCIDCGKEFEVDAKANRIYRCKECNRLERKRINKEYYKKQKLRPTNSIIKNPSKPA